MVTKLVYGFCFGTLFIVISGLIYGGILFSDFLPRTNSSFYFIILGLPYGLFAAIACAIFLNQRKSLEGILKKSLFFGVGFWLSFALLYIIGYFASSNFSF